MREPQTRFAPGEAKQGMRRTMRVRQVRAIVVWGASEYLLESDSHIAGESRNFGGVPRGKRMVGEEEIAAETISRAGSESRVKEEKRGRPSNSRYRIGDRTS